MLNVNFFIQSLLEADNTNANAAGEGTDDNATEDTGGNDPNATEDQTDTANQNQDDKQTDRLVVMISGFPERYRASTTLKTCSRAYSVCRSIPKSSRISSGYCIRSEMNAFRSSR